MEAQLDATGKAAGTSLAIEPGVAESTRPADVWRRQRDRMLVEEAGPVRIGMLAMGAFVQLAIVAILFHADYPTWRIASLIGVYAVFAATQSTLHRRLRIAKQLEHAFIGLNLAAQVFVVVSAVLTGGLQSPLVPSLVLPAIISLLFFGPIAVSRWIALANGCLIVAIACLPSEVVGPALPFTEYAVGLVLALGWNLFMLHMVVGKLTVAASRAGESMQCLREEYVSDAEERLHRLQSVGAKVAHELKNPLASIKGLCQLIARTPDSTRTQERLAVVASEISRMETILAEYLSFSRPLEDLKPETLDLRDLSQDVLDGLAGRADQAGVSLTLDGPPTEVRGDPRRLKEALINLVANAIEATPHGGSVWLRLRNSSAVTLEVTDTGRGIAPEDLERLGTSFFTTRPNGTGLGVVLATGVIVQHGGQLKYTSGLGRGTTATITLPSAANASPEPAARAAMVEARA
jgi:signal transduction histidine kinase